MSIMSDAECDAFLLEIRLGNLAVSRRDKGPLLVPIWYRYTPGGTIDMCMGARSAKAHRLRAEGRATLSVVDDQGGVYRYVAVEGPVEIISLGDSTRAEILKMSTRYLGELGGERYTEKFMAKLVDDSFV